MNNNSYYTYRLALTYFTFRIILSLSLAGISLIDQEKLIGGHYQSLEFMAAVIGYFALTLTTHLYTLLRARTPRNATLFFAIVSDVLFCLLFIHLAGGFGTGLGILLLSPVAIAGIFFFGVIAFSIAAISTIGMLAHVTYMALQIPDQAKYFVPAGLLGMLFFAASLATQLIARHIRRTEQLAGKNIDLAEKLSQINELIVQKMQTGIIVVDAQGRIQLINDSACELLGKTLHRNTTLTGKLHQAFLDWQKDASYIHANFQEAPGLPHIRASFTPVQDENSDTIIFLDNQSLLTQQAQHLKLASLGRLSAGIAHEIRNPLSAITHAGQLLEESETISSQDKRLLQMINNHAVRLDNIVSNVLDISRRQPSQPGKVDLQACLEKVIRQIEQSKQVTIDAEIDLPEHPLHVPFDESQLQQVLSNLIDNAVTHSAKEQTNHWVGLKASINNGIARLSICDKGPGIAPQDVEKAFEPFYTTHAKGTGLGLFIARELCEMNQAFLDYVSDDSGNTCFQIHFAHLHRRLTMNERHYE